MERKAVFAGSFNPFTIGHMSVLERALPLFDHIIVAVGVNVAKSQAEVAPRLEQIRGCVERFGKAVTVETFNGLTAEFARSRGAGFLLRGVRSAADFEYERNMADLNRRIAGVETVLLYALPEHGAISSSAVRELSAFGADVSSFLP